VVLENTVNKGGGCCWALPEIQLIRGVCDERQLVLHLDGARLFNALVAQGGTPREYGALFDTISICLSKGLGAPAGSLLLGSRERIGKAHRLRKLMGGGMRQVGYLAAAGSYALDHHVARLEEDHYKARALAGELQSLPFIAAVLPVETNIVIFELDISVSTETFLAYLLQRDIKALSFGKQAIRFVFHMDVSDGEFETLCSVMRMFRGRID